MYDLHYSQLFNIIFTRVVTLTVDLLQNSDEIIGNLQTEFKRFKLLHFSRSISYKYMN